VTELDQPSYGRLRRDQVEEPGEIIVRKPRHRPAIERSDPLDAS